MAELTDNQLDNMTDKEISDLHYEAVEQAKNAKVPETEILEEEIQEEEILEYTEEIDSEDVDEEDVEEDLEDIEDLEDETELYSGSPENPDEGTEDHNDSDEDEGETEEEEDLEDTDTETPDGESVEGEDKTTDTTEELEDNSQREQKVTKFKANGVEYSFTEKEQLEMFPQVFGQAMDYSKKTQGIAKVRKRVDALDQANIGEKDLNLLIDAFKGNKQAIAEIAKRTDVDVLDLDMDSDKSYVANDYGRDEKDLAVVDVITSIENDIEFSTTKNILEKEWDDRSWKAAHEDPSIIQGLHSEIQSGMYQKIKPLADKLKVYGGAKSSDLDYYNMAVQQYNDTLARESVRESDNRSRQLASKTAADEAKKVKLAKAKEAEKVKSVKDARAKREAAKKASTERKKARVTNKRSSATKVTNAMDLSESEFDELYEKIMSSGN